MRGYQKGEGRHKDAPLISRWDSNPQPPVWKTGALSIELREHRSDIYLANPLLSRDNARISFHVISKELSA